MRSSVSVGYGYDVEAVAGDELLELAGEVDDAFQRAGIKVRTREEAGHVVYEMLVPAIRRPIVISARVALPSVVGYDEVGRKKFGAKLKKFAKKVAKSKVLKKLAKIAGPLAAIVPGMQPVAAGIAAATAAKKIAMAAKKGHKGARKLLKPVAKGLTKKVKKAKVAKAPKAKKRGAPMFAARLQAPKLRLVSPATYTVTSPDGDEQQVEL